MYGNDTIVVDTREQWLEVRGRGIGASDAAALLGLSRFKNAYELYHEKKGLLPPNKAESFARKIGLALEDPIAALYREETGRPAIRPKPGTFTLERNRKLPWLLATLDGVTLRGELLDLHKLTMEAVYRAGLEGAGVLEIKTAAFIKRSEWVVEPPLEYIVQVQHQMAATDAPYATLAALVGGVYFVWADVERDQAFIDGLLEVESEFVRRLELNDPPPIDGSAITKAVIKALFPAETTATPAILPPEALEWDAQRQAAKDEITRQEGLVNEANSKLRAAIGEHAGSGLMPNGARYTLKTITKKPYSVTPTPYRELRRLAPKGEKKHGASLKPGEAPQLEGLEESDLF
jgi:putative phage-type endonuclease